MHPMSPSRFLGLAAGPRSNLASALGPGPRGHRMPAGLLWAAATVSAAAGATPWGPQGPGTAPAPALGQVAGPSASDQAVPLLLGRGQHRELQFPAHVLRVAVGDAEILSADVLDSRLVLLTGLEVGVTSLLLWFEDGGTYRATVAVRRDLTLLAEILRGVHPAIRVEVAPDRDVVVLRGEVPTASVRQAAGAAAEAYLAAGRGARVSSPTLIATGEGADGVANSGGPAPRGAVVNLLTVLEQPVPLERRLAAAIEPYGKGAVQVRRHAVGPFPDDTADVFVLTGEVADQVTLSRVLFVASRVLLGAEGLDDVRVLADEAGALTQVDNLFGANNVGGGQQQGLRPLGNNQLGGGGGGAQQTAQLANRIGAQLGRAKLVAAAGGRLLSTIQVQHLPLVRVDVRLYEVDRGRLRTWRNQMQVAAASFTQQALPPSSEAQALLGPNALPINRDEIQGLLGFLNGTLAQRTQFVSGGWAVDNLFQLLVEEQVARSLSNPSLAVLSGELAQFQVGGQIPIPVALTVGGGTDQVLNGVQFQDFGIDLTVRPLVEEHDSDRITLDVVPRISLPDLALTAAIGSATGQPAAATAFESRSTRTHARLFDGDALLIGGLTTQRSQRAQARTPWLGDLPLVGWLFRNEAEDAGETELVVVVLPALVREPRPAARLWAFPSRSEVHARCLERARQSDPARRASGPNPNPNR